MFEPFKRLTSVVALTLLLMVAGGCGPSSNPDTVCDSLGCISLSKFSANISNTLSGNVTGYVSFVGTLPSTFGGQARTAADPPAITMLPDLPTNVASVSKVLTTIAVLQSLTKHNLTIDDKISPYLWPSWTQGMNVNTITFRDLLTHKSGFRVNCGGSNTTYFVLKQQIADGVTMANKAAALYNNCNFAIFRELLMFMEGGSYSGPDWLQAYTSAAFYINYMNQHVFQPLGMPAQDCKPPSGTNDILSYPFPAGSTHGADWGDWTLACGGGGWVLSAGDLAKVMLDLTSGNVLLTNAQKTEMNSNCLGWDCSVRSDCPSPYVCKNGDLPNGGIAIWTYLGIIKCNVPVVVIANSPLPAPYNNNGDIIGLVQNAYNGAAVSGTPVPCPILLAQQVPPRVQLINTLPPPTPLPLPAQTRLPGAPQPTASLTRIPTPRDTQAPRPPVLVAPIDGAAVDCGRVSLTWKPAADAGGIRGYDAELDKLVDRSYVSEKTWNNEHGESVPFDATCDTHYRWRVRATDNSANQSAWSGYGFFRSREAVSPAATPTRAPTPRGTQAPRPPVQLAPVDGVPVDCGKVSLTWKPAADASGIRDDDVELEKLADRTYVAEKTWNNVRGDAVSFDSSCDTHYRWRVRATDNAGNQGAWSAYQDFHVRASVN